MGQFEIGISKINQSCTHVQNQLHQCQIMSIDRHSASGVLMKHPVPKEFTDMLPFLCLTDMWTVFKKSQKNLDNYYSIMF